MDPRYGRVAFGFYADDWIAGRHDLAMRTKQDYEDLIRLHLKPVFGPHRWLTFQPSPSAAGGLRQADRTGTDGHRRRTDFSERSSTLP